MDNNMPSVTSPTPPTHHEWKLSWLKWVIIIFIAIIVLVLGAGLGYAYMQDADLTSLNSILTVFKPVFKEAPAPSDRVDDLPNPSVKPVGISEEEATCVPAGGIITPESIQTGGNAVCCVGLKLVLEKPDRFSKGYCLKCGDGLCNPPENNKLCPADCPIASITLSPEELKKDSDQDGLPDYAEAWYSTDPQKADSDNDGFNDGDELMGGYSPTGDTMLVQDFSTPESAIITLEHAKADCEGDVYRDRIYIPDSYYDNMLNLMSMMGEAQFTGRDEVIDELKADLENHFFDSRIYENEIEKIIFTNRKYVSSYQVALKYEVHFLPDKRGYTPVPQEEKLIVSQIDDRWVFDIYATTMDEVFGLETAREKSRDAKRVADVKQVQTALELYFNDSGRYPESITVGQSISYETTTYMSQIPANPKEADGDCPADSEYSYLVKDEGRAYELNYCLGSQTGGIPSGMNIATPAGVSDKYDKRRPLYKRCYYSTEEKDNARISDVKQLQTAFELYFNDFGVYPDKIVAGEEIKGDRYTYMQAVPSGPEVAGTSCAAHPGYQYTQKDAGAGYELVYCLEEGASKLEAGVHTATPAGIGQ